MKLLIFLLLILLLVGCATALTEAELEEREYDYQEYTMWFRRAVENCIRDGGYILLDNPFRRYPQGIANHPRPNLQDMERTYCVPRSGRIF